MSNDIINAVKRLERAGSESSRTTEKLFEAATKVAEIIEKQVPVGVILPRGYKVVRVKSNVSSEIFLAVVDSWNCECVTGYIDGIGRYLHGDFSCWIPEQKRDIILQFAKDIANGLLDDIAEFLENRSKEENNFADILISKQ